MLKNILTEFCGKPQCCRCNLAKIFNSVCNDLWLISIDSIQKFLCAIRLLVIPKKIGFKHPFCQLKLMVTYHHSSVLKSSDFLVCFFYITVVLCNHSVCMSVEKLSQCFEWGSTRNLAILKSSDQNW